MVSDDLLLHLPPLLLLLNMNQKVPVLTKYTFQQGSIPYQKEISFQYGEMLLEISYWTLWQTLYSDLQLSLILSLKNHPLIWWFHFFWFIYIDKNNVNRRRVKWYKQKLRNLKHKVKHTIGCYPKYLLIFTSYQVQGWWTMILSLAIW